MANNVIRLPRPKTARPTTESLGLYIRVGRNDHKELLHLLAAGEHTVFGFVVDAQYAVRHRTLIAEAKKRGFDVILDPKTQMMALPGGLTPTLATLPWAKGRPHILSDFSGAQGRELVESVVEFAVAHGFTQVLSPSHIISGPNDPWLRRDLEALTWLNHAIGKSGRNLGIIHSLSMPMDTLRRDPERSAIVHALTDANIDALWLKIENFGDDASGEKTAAFIEAARAFHELSLPIVADHAGGMPAMAALAFGAVGGIAHGITFNQNFSASRWRRPPRDHTDDEDKKKGMATWRVYLPSLDLLMKTADARAFLGVSPRVRGKHGCKDTKCCPHGVQDMLGHAARHAIFQRSREIDLMSGTPQPLRAAQYVEGVRKVSDDVTAVAGLSGLADNTRKALEKKRASVSRFRQVMGHLMSEGQSPSVAIAPKRHSAG